MPEPLLLLTRDGDVATLTFNDPDRLNAMSQAMGEAVAATATELAGDETLRAVVLTGAGRAFSAGGDLAMIESRAAEGARDPVAAQPAIRDTMRAFYALFLKVRDLPCPTIKLGLNFTALGLHPGMGATWTLPRLVGPAHAAELLFSSRTLNANEAAEIGLINRAVAPAEVLPAAWELAAAFARNGPQSVRGVKQALARTFTADLSDQLDFEADLQAHCFVAEDVHEGLAAARERRPPRFTGR